MRKQLNRTAGAVFFFLMIFGCTMCPAAAAGDDGYFPVRVHNPQGLNLFFVQSQFRDGELVVSGKVRRSRLPGRVASAIPIMIEDYDGKILAEKTVTYTPRSLSRHRSHDEARFTASFADVPEGGAVVRIGGCTTTGE